MLCYQTFPFRRPPRLAHVSNMGNKQGGRYFGRDGLKILAERKVKLLPKKKVDHAATFNKAQETVPQAAVASAAAEAHNAGQQRKKGGLTGKIRWWKSSWLVRLWN